MIIAGAGLAGLTAAALLRDECKEVWEAKPSLPDNHAALLRFKSSIVGDSLNIPFKRVNIIKDVDSCGNDLKDALQYSRKTNGSYLIRSIKKETAERYIAPTDFIQRLQKKVMAPIQFEKKLEEKIYLPAHLISTIPMPALIKLYGMSKRFPIDFHYMSGQVISVEIKNCDVYSTLYFPNPGIAAYRVSITGSKMIIEVSGEDKLIPEHEIALCCSKLGIQLDDVSYETMSHKVQPFMKILPIDEDLRKRVILFMTEEFGIYSFGRFATWRPGLLLDDLVKDLRTIQRIALTKNNYDQRR